MTFIKPTPFFTKKPIRWGIIGCGSVTEVKSGPPYGQTQDFELAMVMRRDAKKAEDYANRHGVPQWTDDASQIIDNPAIDAIYIATPPDVHKQYALRVAAAGKPCCIEKPMATNYADALAIYDAFETANLPLFIAYYRRSLPRFNAVKKWLDEGRIGVVRHINWLKTRSASPLDLSNEYNWRTDAKVAKGGYFDDLASHGLDLFSYLLGDIKQVTGIATNQQGLYTAFDAVSGSWIHENGVTGSGSWNFGCGTVADSVEILGDNGKITFSVLDEKPIQLIGTNKNETLLIPHPKHLHEFHVDTMRKHLFGEAWHPSTGKTGLHSRWVLDRVLGMV